MSNIYGIFSIGVSIVYVGLFFFGIIKYKLTGKKAVYAQVISAVLIIIFIANFVKSTDELRDWIINLIMLTLIVLFSLLLLNTIKKESLNIGKINRLADNLEIANMRLQELYQQKTEFVSLASHQLRGPLSSIKGYASLILEGDFGEISDPVREAINKIFQSTQDLVVLVGDYLDVSRIEQGKMKFEFSVFDLKDLVKEVVEQFKPGIAMLKLSVDFHFEEGGHFMVNADRGKIKQVISNLLDNAIKYTPQGGIHVLIKTIKPEKTDFHSKSQILTTITDTGIGISEEVLPRLFEKFTRAPDAGKINIMGTGLGLYVARKMIDMNHGKIWAESLGKGKGSSFYVELESMQDRSDQ